MTNFWDEMQKMLDKYRKKGDDPFKDIEEWEPPFNPLESNPICGHCPKCGLELRQVMGYVCNINNCPTGLGSPMCSV